MKNVKKFIISFLCAAAACLTLGGCEKTSSQIEVESMNAIRAANLEDVRSYTEEYFASVMKSATYESFVKYTDEATIVSMPFDNDWGYRWGQFAGKYGEVKDAVVDLVDKTDDGYTARIILTGDNESQMALTIRYDEGMHPISTTIAEYSDDSQETLGSKMSTAGVNTITGIMVVFVILVLLSLIISCFGLLNKLQETPPEKKDSKPAVKAVPASKVPAASAEVDLSKNEELVAVIAAAIAAAEDRPPEGYVVRSIRRLHNNKWR